MNAFGAWLGVALLGGALVAGCADEASKGAAALPSVAGGKLDAPAVPVQGTVAFGVGAAGKLSKSGEFHGWLLPVRAGAPIRIEMTHKGSSSTLDGTLFIYAPDGTGGWLPDPVAMDDDSGWGRLPRIDHTFAAQGTHLVVAGSFDGIGKGQYRLLATCGADACDPLPAAGCHPALLAGMQSCVADWRLSEDPDMTRPPTTDELVEWCTDAEPVAPVRDALCASAPQEPLCALDYEAFVESALPACREELAPWVESTGCALGAWWYRVRAGTAWGISATGTTSITTADGLSDLEASRIVAALHASAHSDVTDAADAIQRTDDDEVIRTALWDATNGRAYEAYTFYAGDNLFGMVFAHGATTPVARINDGDIMDCAVTPGPGLHPCAKTADCAEGLTCVGATQDTYDGRCVSLEHHAAEGADCADDAGCPEASGLVCGGVSPFGGGMCAPAWSRATFSDVADAPIPDGKSSLERTVAASGLLTVTTDGWLRATIAHPAPEQLTVTLINPIGTQIAIAAQGTGGELLIDAAIAGIPTDEPANGTWTLRVKDGKKGGEGLLSSWTLTLGSRWD